LEVLGDVPAGIVEIGILKDAAESNTVLLFSTSAKSGTETGILRKASLSYRARTATTRSGFATPAGLSRTWLTTLKIAVLAPIPNAKVVTAVSAKARFLANARQAKRRSVIMQPKDGSKT